MGLQEKLDAQRAQSQAKIPTAALAIAGRATADLRASGILERIPQAGAQAPEFILPNIHGQDISATDLLAQGPLVVTFYRGVW